MNIVKGESVEEEEDLEKEKDVLKEEEKTINLLNNIKKKI